AMERVFVAHPLEGTGSFVLLARDLALDREHEHDIVAVDPPRALERVLVALALARDRDVDLDGAIPLHGHVDRGLLAARRRLLPRAAEAHHALVRRGRFAIESDRRAILRVRAQRGERRIEARFDEP